MNQPEIITQRLLLRAFTLAEAKDVFSGPLSQDSNPKN